MFNECRMYVYTSIRKSNRENTFEHFNATSSNLWEESSHFVKPEIIRIKGFLTNKNMNIVSKFILGC